MIENKKYPPEYLARFLSFSSLHGIMLNTAVAWALFLALGKIVGSVFSAIALLPIFIVSAAVGALLYSLALPEGVVIWFLYWYLRVYRSLHFYDVDNTSCKQCSTGTGIFSNCFTDVHSNNFKFHF